MILTKEPIVLSDTEGRKRKHWTLKCDSCNKIFYRPQRLVRSQKHYCSAKCKSFTERTSRVVACSYCGAEFYRRPSKIQELNFCSRICKDSAQRISSGERFSSLRPEHYDQGTYNYREIAYRNNDSVCNRCGFSNKLALVVHHVDRNRSNNTINNLEILCANCHMIEHRGG